MVIVRVEDDTGVNGSTIVNHIEFPWLVRVWTDDYSWAVERE